MPLYEYECQQCHRHTEKRQKFSDPEITECPHCGGKLQRVISAPNFAFAGGGWYKDLYSSAKPNGGDSPSASDAKSGDPKSTDTKSGDSKQAESKSTGSSDGSSTPASAPTATPAASSTAADKK